MNSKTKTVLTVVAFTVLGFLLNPNAPLGAVVFGAPPSDGAEEPTGAQIGLLMAVGLVESIAFGLGAALLLLGGALVRRLAAVGIPARAAWLATVWGLMSWVPHTALHMTAGDDMARLIAIEYGFHVTLVVAAIFVARFLVDLSQSRSAARLASPDAHPVGGG